MWQPATYFGYKRNQNKKNYTWRIPYKKVWIDFDKCFFNGKNYVIPVLNIIRHEGRFFGSKIVEYTFEDVMNHIELGHHYQIGFPEGLIEND